MSTMTESLATVSVTVGEQEITFETGQAGQAGRRLRRRPRRATRWCWRPPSGGWRAREGADFFPLTVDVEERMYAAGKIPGGFFKREGRPTERAILTARMIDRPIRPLWPKGYKNEVHVVCTTLSADLVTAHDILVHQRRLGRADGLAAALPRPGGRRPDRTRRRRVRRQPDAAGRRGGEHARPDRRRHEGRADDDRGGRRRDPRGRDPRGVRARARRDREDLRRAGGPAPRRPASRSTSIPSSPPSSSRSTPAGSASASRPTACARRARSSRSSSSELAPAAEHGVERGGHPARRSRFARRST